MREDTGKAIEHYYQDNYETLTKSIANRVGGLHNAEDIVQETFYRALKYIDSFEPGRSELQTWVSSILRRAMYDFKRAELKQGMATDNESSEEPVTEMDGFDQKMVGEITKEIEGRRENHRNILYLFFVKNYPPRDIVQIVDENLLNVKKVLQRFKNEMREKYEHN